MVAKGGQKKGERQKKGGTISGRKKKTRNGGKSVQVENGGVERGGG